MGLAGSAKPTQNIGDDTHFVDDNDAIIIMEYWIRLPLLMPIKPWQNSKLS
jgi:hypothetical protein